MEGGSNRSWVRAALLAVAILAALGLVYLALDRLVDQDDLAALVERLRAFGGRWWAPLALVGGFVVVNLTGLPGTPLTLAAGVVWGWLGGGLWAMAATMIGTSVPYFIARNGFTSLKGRLERRFEGMHERVRAEGMTALLVLRLSHMVPFAVLSYVAGIAGLRPRDFFIATFFGAVPGVFIYTYLADSLLAGLVSPDEAKWRVLFSGFLLASLVLGTRLVARRFHH